MRSHTAPLTVNSERDLPKGAVEAVSETLEVLYNAVLAHVGAVDA